MKKIPVDIYISVIPNKIKIEAKDEKKEIFYTGFNTYEIRFEI